MLMKANYSKIHMGENNMNKKILCLLMATFTASSIFMNNSSVCAANNRQAKWDDFKGEAFVDNAQIFANRVQGLLQTESIHSLINDKVIKFTYDQEGNRVTKTDGDSITYYEYNNNGQLIKETCGNQTIDYIVDSENNTIGFWYNGKEFTYQTDEYTDSVVAIEDENKEVVAKYEYDSENDTNIYGMDDNGEWVSMTNDQEFVGNINPYRYSGFYYDKESGYYFYGGRFYDAQTGEYYTDSDSNSLEESKISDIWLDKNINKLLDRNVSTYGVSATAVDEAAKALLRSSSFGNAVNYSENWYLESDSIEILARLIYGENNVNLTDQPAIAWVLTNRYEAQSSTFGKTLYDIATKKYQFSSIHPGSDQANQTKFARRPDTSSKAWAKATWLACAVYQASGRTNLASLQPKPDGIDKQCYFVSVTYAKSHMTTRNGYLYYDGNKIKNATLVGIQKNMTTMYNINYYGGRDDYRQYYNVFFSYSGDSYF